MLTVTNLRPWQAKAVAILQANPFQLLGAQPGAGKTIVTLTALMDQPKRTLLIAPRVILDSVWRQEAQRWAHTQHLTFDLTHQQTGEARSRLWIEGQGDITTCTPDVLVRLVDEVHRRHQLPAARLVVDESQMFKNAYAVRTQALQVLAEVLPTWLLSGTPMPNGPLDAWSPGFLLSKRGEFWQ
jgi:SNF2 family DNA or RNA helicase